MECLSGQTSQRLANSLQLHSTTQHQQFSHSIQHGLLPLRDNRSRSCWANNTIGPFQDSQCFREPSTTQYRRSGQWSSCSPTLRSLVALVKVLSEQDSQFNLTTQKSDRGVDLAPFTAPLDFFITNRADTKVYSTRLCSRNADASNCRQRVTTASGWLASWPSEVSSVGGRWHSTTGIGTTR